jgi:PHP family Zn ribbon phosphoesterase
VRYPPDAIEGRSNNVRAENVARIRRLAESHGLPVLCNSDAHTAETLGGYYNLLDLPDMSDESLIRALRQNHLRHSVTS